MLCGKFSVISYHPRSFGGRQNFRIPTQLDSIRHRNRHGDISIARRSSPVCTLNGIKFDAHSCLNNGSSETESQRLALLMYPRDKIDCSEYAPLLQISLTIHNEKPQMFSNSCRQANMRANWSRCTHGASLIHDNQLTNCLWRGTCAALV